MVPYRKAHELRNRQKNQELWLQGLYIYKAIGAFVEILPAFPKKGAKIYPYDNEPIAITDDEIREKEQKKMLDMRAKMDAWRIKFNSQKPSEVQTEGDSCEHNDRQPTD